MKTNEKMNNLILRPENPSQYREEAWESLGAKIRGVGSFRSGLMIKDHDIDLHLYTETLDIPQTLRALEPILASPKTLRLTYINGADNSEHCLEWHLQFKDEAGEKWTVDMMQILANSDLDGFLRTQQKRLSTL